MRVLITGTAGFIGFHLANQLASRGHELFGIDNLNDYYDVGLKQARLAQLKKYDNFNFVELDLADSAALGALFNQYDLFPCLGGFKGCGHATDSSADHENSLIGCDYFRHG